MPSFIRAEVVSTPHGKVGYIRIYSFDVEDPDELVSEFIRLVSASAECLIIDVRDNGGDALRPPSGSCSSFRRVSRSSRSGFISSIRVARSNCASCQKSNVKFGPFGLAPWD